ncbi:hypothetical protein BDV96DRAFT_534778 [Lophiotrema nucula]|uniref:N-acetyltransferase domain-containing protein n=1 Tax=Lophiotrema nucula TaxID=690887 RepID=A0A6A5YH76_9PLEO|nr:hypothetical protein BDV96DRAFT_534778 [Lophiotrema nucula]
MVTSASSPSLRAVKFHDVPTIQYIDPSPSSGTRKRLNLSKQLFERFDGGEVTNEMLVEASQLFNENYGVWGKDAARSGAFAKPGARVRLSTERLRAQYLPPGAACSYVRVTIDDCLAGNAFACRWTDDDKTICWVTQLVVHRDYRERGIAVSLLNQIREYDDDIYGLMSSHPAACLAAAKAFNHGINTVQLDFIRKHAGAVVRASPISYVKDADLRGSLFDNEESDGVVSSVYTNFFVDHTKPLEALAWVQESLGWPLGELLDGHEFLFLLESRRRGRSRSRSNPRPPTVS